jgi:hypothetical protein
LDGNRERLLVVANGIGDLELVVEYGAVCIGRVVPPLASFENSGT